VVGKDLVELEKYLKKIRSSWRRYKHFNFVLTLHDIKIISMLNFKFACQYCQRWQPEMRLDYSGTKTIQIFIVTNTRFYYMSVIIVSRFVISVKMNVNDPPYIL
jgi:hypothetical protein